MIGYIVEKRELTLLMLLVNGNKAELAEKFCKGSDGNEQQLILDRLEKKGYIFRGRNKVDVERTIAFLIYQLGQAAEAAISADNMRYVYWCPELLLMLEEDRLNKSKCRLVPFENENSLCEYLKENEIFLGTRVKIKEVNDFGTDIEC